jgi:hypothetical protein
VSRLAAQAAAITGPLVVPTHMSYILAKLGAQSRLQVASEADRHRTDQPRTLTHQLTKPGMLRTTTNYHARHLPPCPRQDDIDVIKANHDSGTLAGR